MPSAPHVELIDKENEGFLGTLTHPAWVGLSVEEIASDWYRADIDVSYLAHISDPTGKLVETARYSSAAIGGEGRKDLRDAIIGSPQQSTSLSVGVANMPSQGNTDRPIEAKASRGRGF